MSRWMFVLFVLLASSLLTAASCSLDAYRNSCANCKFDEKGKMDQACAEEYKSLGIACISMNHPSMVEYYQAGECPEVDNCASQLSACVSASSSGDDRKDCNTGATRHCYVNADKCIEKASMTCAERNRCSAFDFTVLLTFGLFGFYLWSKK